MFSASWSAGKLEGTGRLGRCFGEGEKVVFVLNAHAGGPFDQGGDVDCAIELGISSEMAFISLAMS